MSVFFGSFHLFSKVTNWLAVAIICGGVLTVDELRAADIFLVPTGTAVDLVIVSGEILPGDADRFAEIVRLSQSGAVLLESPGGSLLDGLRIGRTIRDAGFSTGVAPDTACASACALAWLGGIERYMNANSLVGFHAAYVETDGQVVVSGIGNALVGAYLNDLGLSDDAVIFVAAAAPNDMNWLNAAQAKQAGIDLILLEADGSAERVENNVVLQLPTGFRWIVLESSASLSTLKTLQYADQIVQTQNGYFAAVAGPYELTHAERLLLSEPFIPEDAYLSSGNGFVFSYAR
jgi:hypothetical protein